MALFITHDPEELDCVTSSATESATKNVMQCLNSYIHIQNILNSYTEQEDCEMMADKPSSPCVLYFDLASEEIGQGQKVTNQ